jgi:hypothetical protein
MPGLHATFPSDRYQVDFTLGLDSTPQCPAPSPVSIGGIAGPAELANRRPEFLLPLGLSLADAI